MFGYKVELPYGIDSINKIGEFLQHNYIKDYTLSIYNIAEESTIEVICNFDDMINVISYVSDIEHDFPAWIGVNPLSDSYVVGINFTRGQLYTPSICEWKDGHLIERHRD